MYRVVSFVVLLSLFAPSVCRPQWREEGQAVADVAWRKSADSFGAALFLSRDPTGSPGNGPHSVLKRLRQSRMLEK